MMFLLMPSEITHTTGDDGKEGLCRAEWSIPAWLVGNEKERFDITFPAWNEGRERPDWVLGRYVPTATR